MSTNQEKLFCPECGTQNLVIASFCINCGLDLRNIKRKGHDDFLLLKEHLEPLNYKLENKINEVYSGTNFLGEHIPTGKKVVIKLTNQEYSNDPDHRSFIKNGAIVAQLFDHPNIHKVFLYGEIENRPYIISDFAENGPLNWTLDFYGTNGVPIPIAINYMIKILEALDHVHQKGYIHKDLKINNIFIMKNGEPVISGFNFSHREDEVQQVNNKKLFGTVAYMSPERCRLSKNIDNKSDIYSAGIIFYQLLTGELPFQGDTHTLLFQQTNKPLPVVTYRLIARGLNSRDKREEKLYLYVNELQNIIETACAKSKKARFSTAKDFANALREFLNFVNIPLPEKKSKNEQWKVLKGYEADQSGGKGEDRLGITGSVESFARLISSRSVQPPLSIGLFGNWGSGKSFFIGKLKTEIDKITQEMRKAIENGSREPELPFYSKIVQIEFNAWHFVDANLWPSLVHHLFSNLKIQGESGKGLEERRKYLIQKIEGEKQGLSDLEKKEQDFLDKLSSLEKEAEEESLRYSERIGNIFKQKISQEIDKNWNEEKLNKIAQKWA
jgi:serine/threonine protein kinase